MKLKLFSIYLLLISLYTYTSTGQSPVNAPSRMITADVDLAAFANGSHNKLAPIFNTTYEHLFTETESPLVIRLQSNPGVPSCTEIKEFAEAIMNIRIGNTDYTYGREASPSFVYNLVFDIELKGVTTTSTTKTFAFTLYMNSQTSEFVVEQEKIIADDFGSVPFQRNGVNINPIKILYLSKIRKTSSTPLPSPLTPNNINFSLRFNYKDFHKTNEYLAAPYISTYFYSMLHFKLNLADNQSINNSSMQALNNSFKWYIGYDYVNDMCFRKPEMFQVQILRLYNLKPDYANDNTKCYAIVDWSKATTFEVKSELLYSTSTEYTPLKNYIPTEGTGFYIYRVRPIFNYYGNGLANSLNYGEWNSVYTFNGTTYERKYHCEYKDGDIIEISNYSITSNCAYYIEIDEKLNWVHNRNFSEGLDNVTQTQEQMMYYDNLLNLRQTQSRVLSSDQIVAQQSILDMIGRPVGQSLPVPLRPDAILGNFTNTSIKYRPNMLLNASNALFSGNSLDNLFTSMPTIGTSSLVHQYYDGDNTFGNNYLSQPYQVPSASSLPYSFTMLSNDGLARPEFVSSPGDNYKITNPANAQGSHATQYLYGKATQKELYAMFGNQAPLANKISKNYVIDPNGKINISYINNNNQVIATALGNNSSVHPFTVEGQNPYGNILEGEFEYEYTDQIPQANTFYIKNSIVFPVGTNINTIYTSNVPALTYQTGCNSLQDKIKGKFQSNQYSVNENIISFPPRTYVTSNIRNTKNLSLSGTNLFSEEDNYSSSLFSSTMTSGGVINGLQGEYKFYTKLDISESSYYQPLLDGINEFYISIYDEYRIEDFIKEIEKTKNIIINAEDSDVLIAAREDLKTTLLSSQYKGWTPLSPNKLIFTMECNIKDTLDLDIECNDCSLDKYKTNMAGAGLPEYDYAFVVLQALRKKYGNLPKTNDKLPQIYGRDKLANHSTYWTDFNKNKSLGMNVNNALSITLPVAENYSQTSEDKNEFAYFFYQYGLPLGIEFKTVAYTYPLDPEQEVYYRLEYRFANVYDAFNSLITKMRADEHYGDSKVCKALDYFIETLSASAFIPKQISENNFQWEFNTNINTLDLLFEGAGGRALKGATALPTGEQGFITNAHHYYQIFQDSEVYVEGKSLTHFLSGNDLNTLCALNPTPPPQDDFGYLTPNDFGVDACGGTDKKAHERHYLCYSSNFVGKNKSAAINENIAKAIEKGSGSTTPDGTVAINSDEANEFTQMLNKNFSEELVYKYFAKAINGYITICSNKKGQFEHSIRTLFHNQGYYFEDEDFEQVKLAFPAKTFNVNHKFYLNHLNKLSEMLIADCKRYTTALKLEKNSSGTLELKYDVALNTNNAQEKYLAALHKGKDINIDYLSFKPFIDNANFNIGNSAFSGQGINCQFQAQGNLLYKDISYYRDDIEKKLVLPMQNNLQAQINSFGTQGASHYTESKRFSRWESINNTMNNAIAGYLGYYNYLYDTHDIRYCFWDDIGVDYLQYNIKPNLSDLAKKEKWNSLNTKRKTNPVHYTYNNNKKDVHIFNIWQYFALMPKTVDNGKEIYFYNQNFHLGELTSYKFPSEMHDDMKHLENKKKSFYPIKYTIIQESLLDGKPKIVWSFETDFAWIGISNENELIGCSSGSPFIDPSFVNSIHKNNSGDGCKITYTFKDNPKVDLDLIQKQLCAIDKLDIMKYTIVNKFYDAYQKEINKAKGTIEQYYRDLPNKVTQNLKIKYNDKMTYFTLYFYDRAGNLVKTVPPQGSNVNFDRNINISASPVYSHETKYKYNSRGQVIETKSPDETQSNRMWYNFNGQLRFSQSARQQVTNRLSYNLYDNQGRIYETGEIEISGSIDTYLGNNIESTTLVPTPPFTYTFRTLTYYNGSANVPDYPGLSPTRNNLRNRINYVVRDEDGNLETKIDQVTSYYSYDLHGNVEYVIQKVPVSQFSTNQYYLFATTEYEYDLLSKKVKKVWYNYGQSDSHLQNYIYDSDNRLTKVESSRYAYLYDRDANYYYYPHGPLKRIELGEDKIQGIDYTYTLQGWLKGINHVDKTKDPGQDMSGDYPQDAFSMILNYNNSDFINSSTNFTNARLNGNSSSAGFTELFDGNIASWENNNAVTGASTEDDYVYKYDLVSRLKQATTFNATINLAYPTNSNNSSYSYDANGNIDKLSRFIGNNQMDNLSYNYRTAGSNRLSDISDGIIGSPNLNDLESQATNNYSYDASGNLTGDQSEYIQTIQWTPDGKVKSFMKIPSPSQPFQQTITYRYDAMGQRVMKLVNNQTTSTTSQTIYARDANGQVMAIYERTIPNNVDDNPDTKKCYKFSFHYPTHGCTAEIAACPWTDFIINANGDIEFIRDVTTSAMCGSTLHYYRISMGTIIQLTIKSTANMASDWRSGFGHGTSKNKWNGLEKGSGFCPNYNWVRLEDAMGNVQSTADANLNIEALPYSSSNPNARLKLSEWHIYGNESQGRFVTRYPEHEVFHQWNLSTNEQNNIFSRNLGFKAYELKDHLGNVRTTVSDVKIPNGTSFLADMITKNEYYPFGMLIDGQSVSPTNYRYSFNTQEISTEINQNHTTAEFWEYDSRSGRRWNLDPIDQISISNYATFANNPILRIDWKGDKDVIFEQNSENPDRADFKEVQNDNFWHNLFHGTNGIIKGNNGETVKEFEFADPSEDVEKLLDGSYTHILYVKQEDIVNMLYDAGAFNAENNTENVPLFSRYSYVLREGKAADDNGEGGNLDFSSTHIYRTYKDAKQKPLRNPSPMLFLVENTAHNHMNYGNFLFGAAGATLGLTLTELQLGAHYNSIMNSMLNDYSPQLDSMDDQLSIRLGFDYANSRNFKNFLIRK